MPSTICAEPLETDGQTWNTSIISGKGGWRNGSGVNSTCCFCRGSRFVPSTHVVAHNYLELQAQEIWQPPSGFYRHLLVVHIHTCRETIIHIKLKKMNMSFWKKRKKGICSSQNLPIMYTKYLLALQWKSSTICTWWLYLFLYHRHKALKSTPRIPRVAHFWTSISDAMEKQSNLPGCSVVYGAGILFEKYGLGNPIKDEQLKLPCFIRWKSNLVENSGEGQVWLW